MVSTIIQYTDSEELFNEDKRRLVLVQKYNQLYHFFHPQLEFLEVFWERGGFDLIVGNPPWIKFTFEEKGIISEKFPEVAIRNVTAPQVRTMQSQFFSDEKLKELYILKVLIFKQKKLFQRTEINASGLLFS